MALKKSEFAKRKGRAQTSDEGDTELRKRRTKSKAASPAMGSVPAVSAASDAPAFKAPPGTFSVLGVDESAGKGGVRGEYNTLDQAKAVADREAGPYGRYPETSVFDDKGQEVYKVQLRSRIAIADVWQGLGGRFLLDAYSLEKQYGGDSLDKVQVRLQADGWASSGKGVRWDNAVVEDWRKGDQCIAVSDRVKDPVLLPHIEEVSVGEDDKCILQERHPADEMDDEIDVQEIEKGYEAEHQKRQQAGDDLGGLRRPSLMVVTGGPGSGKLALFNSIETLGSNPVRINPDDIRKDLPEWRYLKNHPEGVKCLRQEANYLAATIIGGVEAKEANIVLQLPGRGRNADILEQAEARGYNVFLFYVHLPVEMAIRRALIRVQESEYIADRWRAVTEEMVRQAHREIREAFWSLATPQRIVRVFDGSQVPPGKIPPQIYELVFDRVEHVLDEKHFSEFIESEPRIERKTM
jgi:predicted ABC-type ATPase